jgi:hypothetical protein
VSPLNLFVYGLAAVIGLGTVAFSVKNADAQKFPGNSELSMTPVLTSPPLTNFPVKIPQALFTPPVKANLVVTNEEGSTEEYKLVLHVKKKATTYNFTLANGQTWARVIPYSVADAAYPILADLYVLPNTSAPYAHVDNGQ